VAEKPSLLVIERDSRGETPGRSGLDEHYDIVVARSMAKALVLLRQRQFAGVYVDSAQLDAVQWAGVMIQADEILDAIADGVAVVDPDLKIIWANPEFMALADPTIDAIGGRFYSVLGSPEILGPDPCPFTSAVAAKSPASTVLRIDASRFLRVTVTPVFDLFGEPSHLIALTRDITAETQQEQKIDAIHKAGEELADLTPEELAEMSVEDRTELLKYNITKHMKGLLGLDFIEIRLLDRATLRLIPLLTEGMTNTAARRELFAKRENNGVTGFVAATGQSYLCPDTGQDPLYLEGAEGAKSSLTVPLLYHGTVIGTLNVENAHPNAFHDRDRQFLEIYARSVASALNTLELLQAEKLSTATASVEAIAREVALPLDDILNDATTVLDRYAGHDEDIVARLRHLLYRAREIRALIQKVGSTIAPEPRQSTAQAASSLSQSRLLVVDSDESVRRSAHSLMYRQGSTVETAQNAHEAIALARLTPYSAALVDIRLPDMEGYEVYKRLREVQPGLPIILMTGFGYDPTHSIVKARQDGLQTVLYKPFRVDRLMEAVEQALRQPRAESEGGAATHPEAPPS
jgi:CheY-like chemotaxis protein/PAS domain-containing protein